MAEDYPKRVSILTVMVIYMPLIIFLSVVSFGACLHWRGNNLHLLDAINGFNPSSATPHVVPNPTTGNLEVQGDPGKVTGSERVVGNTVYYTHSAAQETVSNMESGVLALLGTALVFLFWSFPFVLGVIACALGAKSFSEFCWVRNPKRIRFSFKYPQELESSQKNLVVFLSFIAVVIGIIVGSLKQSLPIKVAYGTEVLIRGCWFFGWVLIWGWTIWKLRHNPPEGFKKCSVFVAIFLFGLGLIGLFGFYADHESVFYSFGKTIWIFLIVAGLSILISAIKQPVQPKTTDEK